MEAWFIWNYSLSNLQGLSKTPIEDDVAESLEGAVDNKRELSVDANLLSVDQLLESVCLPLSLHFHFSDAELYIDFTDVFVVRDFGR